MTELGLELSLDSRDGDDDLEDEGDGDLDQHVEFELETLAYAYLDIVSKSLPAPVGLECMLGTSLEPGNWPRGITVSQ